MQKLIIVLTFIAIATVTNAQTELRDANGNVIDRIEIEKRDWRTDKPEFEKLFQQKPKQLGKLEVNNCGKIIWSFDRSIEGLSSVQIKRMRTNAAVYYLSKDGKEKLLLSGFATNKMTFPLSSLNQNGKYILVIDSANYMLFKVFGYQSGELIEYEEMKLSKTTKRI